MAVFIEKLILFWKIMFLIFVIMLVIAYNTDSMQKTYVESSIETFSSVIQERGFVSHTYYEQVLRDVGKYNYELRMIHKKLVIDASYKEIEDITTHESILNAMYNKTLPESQRLYRMKKGDQFKVIAAPVQPSLFRRLLGLGQELGIIKSGMVFNTPEI